MTKFRMFDALLRSALILALASCSSLLYADGGTVENEKLGVITASGKQIQSIFEGRAPSRYVRDVLILRIGHPRPLSLAGSNGPGIAQTLRRLLVAESPVYLSCPSGGTCGQAGTTSAPGQLCQDADGCSVDVDNQTSSSDPSQGTFETYDCEQCCVDWESCTISSSIGGDDGGGCTGSEKGDQDGGCNPSPIIIDTDGGGFHLTSAQDGVTFDIEGNGHPMQIAWTNPHYPNALLALPGSDGLVHNGKELFGNFTPQPPSAHPNGFIALAQYDKPENGGNGDGIIDERDAVYSRLRLWIDENHDGICQQNELHRLPELGIYSLALKYFESPRTDQFGNQFRYKAQVNPGDRRDVRDETPSGDPGRWAYDVFFVFK